MILSAQSHEHAQMRRALSHGFSDRGIREMEPRMKSLINKMLASLDDVCDRQVQPPSFKATKLGAAVVDLTKWTNWLMFDLIGELTFGESFGCLDTQEYHPWVEPIAEMTHLSGILVNLGFYPKFQALLLRVFDPLLSHHFDFQQNHARAAVARRKTKPDRKDLLTQSLSQIHTLKDVRPIASPSAHLASQVCGAHADIPKSSQKLGIS